MRTMQIYNSKKYKAITIRRTNVKALPTSEAYYRDPKKTGEGFPFDYNQNSALHINVPLFISHFSKDNRWAFVQASYSFGWVKTSDLALVEQTVYQRRLKMITMPWSSKIIFDFLMIKKIYH